MKTKRLTIAGIQIYFDDMEAALFDARGKQRAAVELELAEHQDFIDRWLEASEEPRPHRLTQEEQQLRSALRGLAKGLKRHFDRKFIEITMREAVKHRIESATLTAAQIEDSIVDTIASL